jgi:hypothetical protein
VLESICSERAFVFEMRDMPDPVDLSSSCLASRSLFVRQRKQVLPQTRSAR